MNELLFKIWLCFGIICIVSEFLLPGLVMVFVGLGSLTVALGMQLGYIDNLFSQFSTFFVSSIIYLIPLRLLVLKFVPTSSKVEDIDEDRAAIGNEVEIIEDIEPGKLGRIQYSESSWQAKSENDTPILKGEKAIITGRDNITWIVKNPN
jgi:membrane protein implicated in regulation of membrane protease activity